ncbi:Coiled-coil domain-containing protein 25 [Talaromyces pinophilus]|nr:Coiled-coil domain-containing protein 25 [Talaromyces pinophilus]
MVYYFVSNVVSPSATIYVGKDKFENEELIKHGLESDVCAHVYLRLRDGETWENIPKELLEDCAQLTKANSIEGNKKDNITVIYTPWANLMKNASMATGQVSFHNPKQVKKVFVAVRQNPIVNRLNKTRVEKFPDLQAEKEEILKKQRKEERRAREDKKLAEKKERQEREQLKWQKEHAYDDLFNSYVYYNHLDNHNPPVHTATMSPDKQSSSAKSKKNKKKNQANKQNADSGKAAENEAQNDAVVEEELKDEQEGEENQTQDVNGESKAIADSATEKQKPDEDNDEDNASELETKPTTKPADSEDSSKFDDLVRDRDSLRAEVTELRKSLEQIQHKHEEEMEALQQKLNESEDKKTQAETQFQKLLERVNTIKSQLGERLKEDAEELSQARSRIEELEDQNSALKAEVSEKLTKIADLEKDAREHSNELSNLRNRANLSQQNWLQEKEELIEQESYIRAEFEEAKQAMHNWEVLAMEERSIREGLAEKVNDLEEQLSSLRDEYNNVVSDNNTQSNTIDGLQRALQEIQDARKQELRELVQSSDAQLEELREKLQQVETRAEEANTELKQAQTELERLLPFEKEVKEKNLLIGKLRHEAVTLNDHLTKALRFLKRGKPEDNVDRHVVTNHLLHFLALDRSDPKKFQILQLIAALLQWDDDQREQAGLSRPGTSTTISNITTALKVPSFYVHRTPSTPSLMSDYMENGNNAAGGKETLAELWSNFLEQEAEAAGNGSKRGSTAGLSPQ